MTATATATTPATNGTATAAKTPRKPRTPSPFTPKTRVTIAVHNDVTTDAADTTKLSETLTSAFESAGLAVRIVSRTRKPRKSTKTGKVAAKSTGPSTMMVYLADKDFKFATTAERGVRLDSDTAKLLRQVAETMGLDPNDPASIVAVAKALAVKATTPAATA